MKKSEIDWSLYAILDQEWMKGRDVAELAEEAIRGGATVIQYRNKVDETGDFFRQARRIRVITERLGIPLIINDRLDIALAVDADGIHLGQSDLPIPVVRRLFGSEKVVGISISHIEELSTISGADYLGVGSVYPTGSKTGVHIGGLDLIRSIREKTNLPIVGIGGIQSENVAPMIRAGCEGVAVISAIFGQIDVQKAARTLRNTIDQTRNHSGKPVC